MYCLSLTKYYILFNTRRVYLLPISLIMTHTSSLPKPGKVLTPSRMSMSSFTQCALSRSLAGPFVCGSGPGADWLHSGPPGNDSCWGPSQCFGDGGGPPEVVGPRAVPYCPYGQSAPGEGCLALHVVLCTLCVGCPIKGMHSENLRPGICAGL